MRKTNKQTKKCESLTQVANEQKMFSYANDILCNDILSNIVLTNIK